MMTSCPKCGASMVKNGRRAHSNSQIAQRWTCKSCHTSQFAKITPEFIGHVSLCSNMSLKEITKTWQSRKENGSCQLVIPKALARKAGIIDSQVIVEEDKGTIVIRRLDLQ